MRWRTWKTASSGNSLSIDTVWRLPALQPSRSVHSVVRLNSLSSAQPSTHLYAISSMYGVSGQRGNLDENDSTLDSVPRSTSTTSTGGITSHTCW